jgi:hypothetical protein
MKGVNQVSEFLERIEAVLQKRPPFTQNFPVYVIDPDGSEFGIDMANTVAPAPRLAEQPQPPRSRLEIPVVAALRVPYRTLAPRLNRVIDELNRSIEMRTGFLTESLKRLAKALRALELRTEELEISVDGRIRELQSRIETLERSLRVSPPVLEDGYDKTEPDGSGKRESPLQRPGEAAGDR